MMGLSKDFGLLIVDDSPMVASYPWHLVIDRTGCFTNAEWNQDALSLLTDEVNPSIPRGLDFCFCHCLQDGSVVLLYLNDVPNHGGQTRVAAPLSTMRLSSVAGDCPIWLLDTGVAL